MGRSESMGSAQPWLTWRNFWMSLLTLFVMFSARKTCTIYDGMNQVAACSHQVSQEALAASDSFEKLVVDLRSRKNPPALFFLNKHALNMTYNFLCNTDAYENVHDRFVFVTLDSTARDTLRERWPDITQFYWPTPCLAVTLLFFMLHSLLGVYILSSFRNRSTSPILSI